MLCICDFGLAIAHAEEAIKLSEGTWLSGRCHLLRAIAYRFIFMEKDYFQEQN